MDYDLEACLSYNGQPEFGVEDIKRVLAVWEGENDGDDWRWILELEDGRFVFLQGGCDYTGWDCQSWATSMICDTPEAAALGALGEDLALTGKAPYEAGMGHILNILEGTYADNFAAVYDSLLQQIRGGKSETWRDMMDKEFGFDDYCS